MSYNNICPYAFLPYNQVKRARVIRGHTWKHRSHHRRKSEKERGHWSACAMVIALSSKEQSSSGRVADPGSIEYRNSDRLFVTVV
jgi:hypothetical protein